MNILAYVHLRNVIRSTGAGRVARQMVEGLARQAGVRLRVLADQGDHARVMEEAGEPWDGFHYHLFPQDTSRQQARWFLTNRPRAELYWPEADITYCTAESYVPTRTSRLAVTVHDAAVFEDGAHHFNLELWKQRMKWKFLYSTLARKADMFHTVSQFSADRLAHFFPEIQSRLQVVHNAVSGRFFEPINAHGEAAPVRRGLGEKPFVLLPGGLHFRKNAELVMAAWPAIARANPDLWLVIVNHCDAKYVKRLAELGERVQLTGFVSDDVLCSLYHAARVVWFPSRYEGFGMPVLEAMACGTPVVASDSSSLPEVAGGAALLASAARPDEHVEMISALWNDDGARRVWTAKGQLRAAGFTWSRAASELRLKFEAIL